MVAAEAAQPLRTVKGRGAGRGAGREAGREAEEQEVARLEVAQAEQQRAAAAASFWLPLGWQAPALHPQARPSAALAPAEASAAVSA